MPNMLVRHRIADFGRWEPYFDRDAARRAEYGVGAGYLYRNADDPREIVILFHVEDIGRAREFAQSEELKDIMTEAGVISEPDIVFLEEIKQFTAQMAPATAGAAI